MAQSESNTLGIRVSKEVQWAEVPATPTMLETRVKGPVSLKPLKETRTSQLIRADRNISSRIEVFQAADGGYSYELYWGNELNQLFEAGLVGQFKTIDVTGQSMTLNSGAKTLVRAAGSFNTDGLLVGEYIRLKGFTNAANNTVFRVVTISSATQIVLSDPSSVIVSEGPTASTEYHAKTLRNSSKPNLSGWAGSLLIEQWFSDIGKFVTYRGMRTNQMGFNFRAGEIVEGSIGFMGERGVTSNSTVSGSVTPHSGTTPINATSNVARLMRGSTIVTSAIQGITLDASNNNRQIKVMAKKYAGGINQGWIDVKGQVQAYLEDNTFLDDMIANTSFGLEIVTTDESGHWTIIWIPATRLASGGPEIQGVNTEVMQNFAIEAEAGANAYTMQISRLTF